MLTTLLDGFFVNTQKASFWSILRDVRSVLYLRLSAWQKYARFLQGFVRECARNLTRTRKLCERFLSNLFRDYAMFLPDGCTNVNSKRI